MKDIKRNLSRYVKGIFYFSIMLGVPFFQDSHPMGWMGWRRRLDCSRSPSCWMENLLIVFRTGQGPNTGHQCFCCMDNSRPVNTKESVYMRLEWMSFTSAAARSGIKPIFSFFFSALPILGNACYCKFWGQDTSFVFHSWLVSSLLIFALASTRRGHQVENTQH